MTLQDPQVTLIQQVCAFMDSHHETPPTLSELGERFHISPFHLQRTFKRIMGISPRQYAERNRLGNLKARLREGQSVTHALYNVGFGSSSRLYEAVPDKMGMTPATYSRGGAGMFIQYSLVDSQLGRLLVASTERGICGVYLGHDDADLEQSLFNEYPAAQIERNREGFCNWVEALLEHLQGERPHLDLPLDIQATAFEWKVWQSLMNIPYGETRTYGEIATEIGHPNAARAVAEACNNNPTMLVIPCHRATRQDGSPSQFYKRERSINNKHALLVNEHAHLD